MWVEADTMTSHTELTLATPLGTYHSPVVLFKYNVTSLQELFPNTEYDM
jgi:hypothetical protein